MNEESFVIGVDYGTDSVRSLIVNTGDGAEVAAAVHHYRRWSDGLYCDPSKGLFRQHPSDYLEGLEESIKGALAQAGEKVARNVKAISIDTTGSTPVAVNREGIPLSLTRGFEDNPDAMFILWKDHTAVKEADEINSLCRSGQTIDYTKYSGGIYSSEWFWAKMLHILRSDPKIGDAAYSWVEHCDWIPAVLTAKTDPLAIARSRCAAGHKAMWHSSWDGLPSENFLMELDPLLAGYRKRLYSLTVTADKRAGTLCSEWAGRLGLSPGTVIGVGAFDAHMGAVGAGITPHVLCKVMGTSTCDMLVAPGSEIGTKVIRGICGQVDGSIIPGMVGMEAGQSAFGDIYAWFRRLLLWPVENILQTLQLNESEQKACSESIAEKLIPRLSEEALLLPPGGSGELALDWLNGRRTPDADQTLRGVIAGLNLGSDAPGLFRALVESTAFGAKKIVDRFIDEGVRIDGVIALGGIAGKSPFVMQTVCDALGIPVRIVKSKQACALGAAMFAAVAAGIFPNIEAAQETMGSGFEKEYLPDSKRKEIYGKLYADYCALAEMMENRNRRHISDVTLEMNG